MLSISHSSYPVCNPRKIIANMKSHVIREIVKYVCCEKKLGRGGGAPRLLPPHAPCYMYAPVLVQFMIRQMCWVFLN